MPGEILLYGECGEADGFTAASVRERLAEAGGGPVDIRINSSGGDAFAARAIYAALSDYPGRVVVYIDGLAASAASLIAMAGDEIVIADGAFVMVHAPSTMISGNADALRRNAETLDSVNESYARTYARRTNQSLETVLGWLRDETWFTAAEAVDAGLADRVEGEAALAAAVAADALHRFRRVPAAVTAMASRPAEVPAEARARERIAAILNAAEAANRRGLAEHLALRTGLPAAEAIAILAAAPAEVPAETPEAHDRRMMAARAERVATSPSDFDTRGRAHAVRSWDSLLDGGL